MKKNRLNYWIFEEYRVSVEGLGLFRIAFVLYILFIYGLPEFTWIAGQPDYYFNPRLFSINALFDSYPGYSLLLSLQVLIALGYAFLLVGWHTRKVSVILPLLVIFCKGFSYAFGHLDHDLFAWILPLIMAGSCWGEAYSVDAYQHRSRPPRENNGWSLHLLAVLLGFSMAFSGLIKTLGGWFLLDNKAVFAHFAYNYYVVGRHDLLAGDFLRITSPLFWEFMDWSAVIFELSFLVAMFKRQWYRMVLGVACIFHFLNMIILNIPFTENIGAYLAFLPWTALAIKIPASVPKQFQLWVIFPSILFCALCAIPSWLRQPEIRPLWMDTVMLSLLGLAGVIIIAGGIVYAIRPNAKAQ